MKLILVRHGQAYEKNKGLTSLGKKQAVLIANRFKKEDIDYIYCSDLRRSVDTAKYISKARKQEMECTSLLREVPDQIITQERKNWKNKSYVKKLNEIKSFILKFCKKHKNDTVLIVGHGKLNLVIISLLVGVNLYVLRSFLQNHTCVDVLEEGRKNGKKLWNVVLFNCVSHLPKKMISFMNKLPKS